MDRSKPSRVFYGSRRTCNVEFLSSSSSEWLGRFNFDKLIIVFYRGKIILTIIIKYKNYFFLFLIVTFDLFLLDNINRVIFFNYRIFEIFVLGIAGYLNGNFLYKELFNFIEIFLLFFSAKVS